VSFFLYFYAVKIQITILLFSLCTLNLLASTPKNTDNQLEDNITSSVTSSESIETSSGALSISNGENFPTFKESLNSILGYSIFIFFSVLIIILIDNRNLEKRYKKLVSDFKNKDPLI
jgi:hypothetical protein